jgi:hypothetical protein
MTGYTYDMSVYLGKDRQNATWMMTTAYMTVKNLARRVDGVGYKVYTDNFLSSPDLFDNLHTGAIECCGTVRQNLKGMPKYFDSKALKLKWGDTHARVRGVLKAMMWKREIVYTDKSA